MIWAILAFFGGFLAILLLVLNRYLIPAIDASKHASFDEKRFLQATSALLLGILLVFLVAGIMLLFRIGRFFFPRARPPRTRTPYVDIWSEAGKRMKTPDE